MEDRASIEMAGKGEENVVCQIESGSTTAADRNGSTDASPSHPMTTNECGNSGGRADTQTSSGCVSKGDDGSSVAAAATTDANNDDNKKEPADASPNNEEEDPQETTFPQQLMDMIESETTKPDAVRVKEGQEKDKLVVEWRSNGKSFIIRDKLYFERDVVPKYFSVRCKFMSFVRKLYRWGFRQIEKQNSGTFVFIHNQFIRGDKKRCLKMRSSTKKQKTSPSQYQQQQPYAGFAGMPAAFGNNPYQIFGPNMEFMDPSMMMNYAMARGQASSYASQQSNPSTTNSFSQGTASNDYGMMNSKLGQFMPSQGGFSQFAFGGGGMTSAETFKAGQRLQELEQKQQRLMDTMNSMGAGDAAGGGDMASTEMFNGGQRLEDKEQKQQRFMDAMQPMAGGGSSYNYPRPQQQLPMNANLPLNGNRDMSDIELASELIKRNPDIEPQKALELAKCYQASN